MRHFWVKRHSDVACDTFGNSRTNEAHAQRIQTQSGSHPSTRRAAACCHCRCSGCAPALAPLYTCKALQLLTLTFYIIFHLQGVAAAHADPPLPQMFCLYASTRAALQLQGAAAADADFLHHFHLQGGAVAHADFLYHFAAARCPPPLQMFWLYASTRAAVHLQGAAAADVDFLQHFSLPQLLHGQCSCSPICCLNGSVAVAAGCSSLIVCPQEPSAARLCSGFHVSP